MITFYVVLCCMCDHLNTQHSPRSFPLCQIDALRNLRDCVCAYVCVCVCVCVRMFVHVCVCAYVFALVSVYCMCVSVYQEL